jgi:oligopeptide/dipeptide ABC transporter ATP-binding protein
MYASNIIELTTTKQLFNKPLHPYTQGLMKSSPNPEEKRKFLDPIKGVVCGLLPPPPGCKFHPRCPYAMDICSTEEVFLEEVEEGHLVSCHLFS